MVVAEPTTLSSPAYSAELKSPAVQQPGLGYATPPMPPNRWQLTQDERDEISSSITQTWTEQAIRCYMSGADCANCAIPKGGYSFVCQMNKVVPVLLETLGQPEAKAVNRLYPQGRYPGAE